MEVSGGRLHQHDVLRGRGPGEDPAVAGKTTLQQLALGVPTAPRARERTGRVALSAHGITKHFDGKAANDSVDFSARCGEVHALLGENGAGKTTLISVLCGQYRPDAGEIRVDSDVRRFSSPRDALRAGIGVVHQDLRQVERFTVAENVVLGTDQRVDRRAAERVEEIAGELGFHLEPQAVVARLTGGGPPGSRRRSWRG